MRKILAIAALAGGLMLPLAGASNARTAVILECDHMSMEAAMCGADYDIDMQMCDYSPPSQVGTCQGQALSKWVRCMNTC